jgi:hypothetical protein
MRFSIEPRDGYLHAALYGRDTAEEMRDFLLAVHAACALWEEEELVYYGRGAIRSRLMEHFEAPVRATHYSWELCRDPAAREAELLREHERRFGRLPRYNHDKAA